MRFHTSILWMSGAVWMLGCGDGTPAPEVADEHDEEVSEVHLTAEQLEAAGIAVHPVELRSPLALVEATAEVLPAADRVAHLGSRVPGRVARLTVNEGDEVRAGQVVAVVDSPDLGRAKADYLAAVSEAVVARQIADRERELFDARISSERDWLRSEAEAVRGEAEREAAENRLHALGIEDDELEELESEDHFSSLMNIRTPMGGVVSRRPVSLGQMVEPTDQLLEILDASVVWILVDVYDEHLGGIREGQAVVVRTRAYPDRSFEGRVDNIGAIVEPTTRSVRVRVVLPNPDLVLKPGMFANVQIEIGGVTGDSLVMAPLASVQRDGSEFMVFVAGEVGEFERRDVVVGETFGDWVAIVSGVVPGELVVTDGAFVLKSELGKGELGEHGH